MRLKDWNTPAINICHGAFVVVDVGTGVFCLFHHQNRLASIEFGLAGLMVLWNIFMGSTRIWHRRLRADLERHIEELRAATAKRRIMDVYTTPEQMALENLERICALYGATIQAHRVEMTIGSVLFYIYPQNIYKITGVNESVQTCYQINREMPIHEKVATAMLLLHNNPSIFERWARLDGSWYA